MYRSHPDAAHWEPPAFVYPPVHSEPAVPPDDQGLDTERLRPTGFAEWFALSQTLLPALLFLPGSQAYRLQLRIGAYGISLFAFLLWWFGRAGKREGKHPAEAWLILAFVLLLLEIANPLTSSPLAGVAQALLYFAIFSPLFWAPAYVGSRRALMRILVVLLICNGINSTVGVLQVYDPERWMPRELSPTFTQNVNTLAASTYIGPNGRPIIRPPGLFDTPGAVCGAGTIAALFGLIFFLEPWALWKRAISLGLAVAGISAIYLSHVRASFVVMLGMMAAYAVLLTLQKQRARVVGFLGLAVGLVIAGFALATFLGGTSVQARFWSLIEGDPRSMYYESRGRQVEYALTELASQYPFGAGLARWGMMKGYFGDEVDSSAEAVFAETQPNAWILDGGIFLVLFYSLALGAALIYDITLVRSLRDRSDRLWATAAVSANLGTLALVFSFIPFGTAVGIQYWFIEGALHGAMAHRPRVR